MLYITLFTLSNVILLKDEIFEKSLIFANLICMKYKIVCRDNKAAAQ